MEKGNLGLIGAGSIAEALLKGMLSCGVYMPGEIFVINRKNDERLRHFAEKYGVNTTRDYREVVSKCTTLVIAVKPKDVNQLLLTIREYVTADHVLISVVAGISTAFIESRLGGRVQVIRAMPNTSCQVKESATAVARGRYAGPGALEVADGIFSSVGKVIHVEEEALDAVTGLSGSGPAYVYLMMEAMIEAGIKAGLEREISEKLAIQTVFGAAKMALESGEAPGHLRKKVTSPGGTTMAGIETLESLGFTNSIIEAIKKAAARSRELMMETSLEMAGK